MVQRPAEDHEEYNQTSAYAKRHAKAYTHTFLHAVEFSCAIVLSCEGGNGNAKRSTNCPEDGVEFSVSCPCCGSVCTEVIDDCLNDNI